MHACLTLVVCADACVGTQGFEGFRSFFVQNVLLVDMRAYASVAVEVVAPDFMDQMQEVAQPCRDILRPGEMWAAFDMALLPAIAG
eukprot:257091-Chlamydomonas_euryale.AAC.1